MTAQAHDDDAALVAQVARAMFAVQPVADWRAGGVYDFDQFIVFARAAIKATRLSVTTPDTTVLAFDLLEGLKRAYCDAGDEAKAMSLAAGFSRATGGIDVEFLIKQLGPPRYAQPCFDHEYITPGCPDCGKLA